MVNLDLQESFIQLLQNFGLSITLAKALWVPLPILIVVVFAF